MEVPPITTAATDGRMNGDAFPRAAASWNSTRSTPVSSERTPHSAYTTKALI